MHGAVVCWCGVGFVCVLLFLFFVVFVNGVEYGILEVEQYSIRLYAFHKKGQKKIHTMHCVNAGQCGESTKKQKNDCINPNISEDGPIMPKHVIGKKRVVLLYHKRIV
jgi:hypothetical protein